MSKILPKIFYGLHMVEGVAEYKEPQVNNGNPYRIFVGEQTIKNMNPSFAGKPVYVRHVQGVDLDKLQEEADGYVVRSFFNKADGKNWVEFIVVSDRGHEAIRSGWKLSNAYILKESTGGGLWHGVEYIKEVVNAEYEHLAIVPNPRYDESVILTPEEFKEYNNEKELELSRLANEKGEDKMNLKFWNKKKVDNSTEFESMSVELPKSKIEKTISQLVNEADEKEMEKDKPVFANGDHKVKVGEEEMTVNELVEKHLEMKKNLAAYEGKETPAEEDLEAKKNAEKAAEEKAAAEKKANEEKAAKEKEIAEKKANADAIKNAQDAAAKDEIVDLGDNKVARGKSRYGSGK